MDLIKLYIQEVTRRLPEKTREDIAIELESTIYDMLPGNYSDEDVNQALETLGDPAILASKYKDKPMYLIGPKYFDTYVTLLKLVMPVAITISLITLIIVNILGPVEEGAVLETLIHIFSVGIWNVLNVVIQTFFWITLVFIIVERSDSIKGATPHLQAWTPEQLKKKSIYIPKYKAIKPFELYSGLIWTAIWGTIYFYADHLLGIYENGVNGLRLVTPAFNQDVLMNFWPLVILVIGLEITLSIFKLVKKQWTRPLAVFFMINQFISIIMLSIILTRANLFNKIFLEKMGEIFTATPTIVQQRLVWGAIIIYIISAGWGMYDTFKRANIKSE